MVPAALVWRRLLIMLGLLALAALACNAPLVGDGSTEEPGPGGQATAATGGTSGAPTATLGAPETLPPALETAEAEEQEGDPAATDTREVQPTLRATPNVSPTRRPLPTATATRRPSGPTPTPSVDNSGPLSFDYYISWRISPSNPFVSIARVEITARGGGGGYKYFRDDLPVDGPVFEYQWSSCTGNPGSLRVDSADGQTARTDYYREAPCPTPTPTKSP